jgi:hypothetical protein
MYVGIDVLPLLTSPQKMDFGGHIDFRGRTVAHSFGGSLVKAKKDLISGRETWDGYKAFYALKMFGSKQSITYTGLYLGYANKNFDTIPVVMKTIASNPKVTNFNINMRDIQYEAMWNAGMQVLGKGLGVDMYLGIGASYNKLSSTNSDAYNKPTEFSIQDDNGTDFFSKRKKQTSWNMRLRAGITIGLNMGPKRM